MKYKVILPLLAVKELRHLLGLIALDAKEDELYRFAAINLVQRLHVLIAKMEAETKRNAKLSIPFTDAIVCLYAIEYGGRGTMYIVSFFAGVRQKTDNALHPAQLKIQ